VTIKQAFRALVAINVISITLLSTSIWVQSYATNQLTSAYERRYVSHSLATELRQSSDDLTRLGRTYVVTRDPSYKQQYMDILDIRNGKLPRPVEYQRIYWDFVADGNPQPRPPGESVPLLDLMKQAGFSNEEFAKLSEAKANSDGLVNLEVEAMNLVEVKAATPAEAEANHVKAEEMLHSKLYHHYKAQIMRPVDEFFVLLDHRTQSEVNYAQNLRNGARTFCVITAILVIATVVSLASFINAKVLRAIERLKFVLRKIVKGELPHEIPEVGRPDELGEMARAVEAFRDASADRTRLEQETAVLQAENERRMLDEKVSAQTRGEQQRTVMAAMEHALVKLADGVLTHRLRDAFHLDYDKLRQDFNGAIAKMEEALGAVIGSAQAMNTGAGEIAQGADDLSRRTEQQAASLQQTAAALEQITATVRNTAEGAQNARLVVGKAAAEAAASSQIVGGAVAAMDAIERSSSEISQILGVIDEIAFQTNLLALNAGVEAARAGEAGRGFAVVAQEVRTLAQRSAEAAKEIKTLIANSSREVENGVGLVGQAGDALRRIAEQVSGITGIVEDITHSANEQAKALAEVNTAVNQMDQMTQQNAAMVEQSTAASHALATEASRLAELTRGFQVGGPAGKRTHQAIGASHMRIAS